MLPNITLHQRPNSRSFGAFLVEDSYIPPDGALREGQN